MSTFITGEDNIKLYRLSTLIAALRLETVGMKHSRGSVYALVKKEFGFKGNKLSVLAQLIKHVDATRHALERKV